MKNIFSVILVVCFISLPSFSALMQVFNETSETLIITAFFGSQPEKQTAVLEPNGTKYFNSGLHEFRRLSWHTESAPNTKYDGATPSSTLMLYGNVRIGPGLGSYMLNFDSSGVRFLDKNKWTHHKADVSR